MAVSRQPRRGDGDRRPSGAFILVNHFPQGLAPLANDRRPSGAESQLYSSDDDHPRPIVGPQRNPLPNRRRSAAGRAFEPDLREQRRQDDLHLVEREGHPEADAVAAAEREPLVARVPPLEEPLRPELCGLGIQVRAAVYEMATRAQQHIGWILVAPRSERLLGLPHNERKERPSAHALADGGG